MAVPRCLFRPTPWRPALRGWTVWRRRHGWPAKDGKALRISDDLIESLLWNGGWSWAYERWGCIGLIGLSAVSFALLAGIVWLAWFIAA